MVFCRTGSKKNRQEATQRHRTRLPRRTIQSSVRPFPPGPGDFYFHPEPSLPPQQRLTPSAKFGQGGGREGRRRTFEGGGSGTDGATQLHTDTPNPTPANDVGEILAALGLRILSLA